MRIASHVLAKWGYASTTSTSSHSQSQGFWIATERRGEITIEGGTICTELSIMEISRRIVPNGLRRLIMLMLMLLMLVARQSALHLIQ